MFYVMRAFHFQVNLPRVASQQMATVNCIPLHRSISSIYRPHDFSFCVRSEILFYKTASILSKSVQSCSYRKCYKITAIWCPDTERSIQIAADSDVPSVSHTAYQLISRNDTNTVVIAGHSAHNALFCMQAQALKKKAICIGPVALSEQTARLLADFSSKNDTSLITIYPLKYTTPFSLMKANITAVGTLQSISVDSTFQTFTCDKRRLYHDSNATLHKASHEIIDALSWLCDCAPKPIAATCHETSSVVEHFRLRELESAHLQVGFGATVASIRIASSNHASILVKVSGPYGFFQFDGRLLILEGREGRGVLWRGDGTYDMLLRNATLKALQNIESANERNELNLVRCVSKCVNM